MKTELESLRLYLLLARRRCASLGSEHPHLSALKRELADVQQCFDRLQHRYQQLQKQVEPELQRTSWHMTFEEGRPFDESRGLGIARVLRSIPFPKGIIIRYGRNGHGGLEYVIHHESQNVGSHLEVIEKGI